jgi:endonuclease-3
MPSKKRAPQKPARKPARSAPKRQKKPVASPVPSAAIGERAREVGKRLAKTLPDPRCELDHENAWHLLIATILSAQSTDARINLVTPALFTRYPSPAALGSADIAEVEELVRSTGFFHNKAKAIIAASRLIAERHGGEVPRTLEALIDLPGVARKTANVVLGTAYGIASGVIVDTHAGRVARRLGFTDSEDPVQVETALCALFPQRDWVALGHRLVLHGRYVCLARNPDCKHCPLAEICPSATDAPEGTVQKRAEQERERVETRGGRARADVDARGGSAADARGGSALR